MEQCGVSVFSVSVTRASTANKLEGGLLGLLRVLSFRGKQLC